MPRSPRTGARRTLCPRRGAVIRAVIDTNVLDPGLLSPAGNEALILPAINQGRVRLCCSEDILKEYAAVLRRPKFAVPPKTTSHRRYNDT